jgi:hypothetical protein
MLRRAAAKASTQGSGKQLQAAAAALPQPQLAHTRLQDKSAALTL